MQSYCRRLGKTGCLAVVDFVSVVMEGGLCPTGDHDLRHRVAGDRVEHVELCMEAGWMLRMGDADGCDFRLYRQGTEWLEIVFEKGDERLLAPTPKHTGRAAIA